MESFINCGKEFSLSVDKRKTPRSFKQSVSMFDHSMKDGPERMEVGPVRRPM